MLEVVGLDVSLTSTGVCTDVSNVTTLEPKKRKGCDRMAWIRDMVLDALDRVSADVVVIEAPAYSASSSYAKELGGVWWVVRLAIHEEHPNVEVIEVYPGTLKKYATGKGNASKSLMLVEAVKRLNYQGESDDEADALWLAQIGYDLRSEPFSPSVPESHRAALEELRS